MKCFIKNVILPGLILVLSVSMIQAQCEKIYVHFDKSFYVVGETIWYKAYLTNCPDQNISPSNILHVELLDKTGKVHVHQKLQIQNDVAFGEIKIPTSWVENVYTFRAYTLLIPGPCQQNYLC